MKKLLLAILMVSFMAQFAISQPWLEYIQEPQKEELTLNDFRDAFNRWEDQNQIVDGKKQVDGEWIKVPGYKLFKRWEYFWDLRVNRTTTAFPQTTAAAQFAKYKAENPDKSSSGDWLAVGPSTTTGGYAGLGRVNCIEFHPTDNNTFWVGTPSGGLWKTTNGGSNWECLTDGNDVIGVSDIALANDFTTSNTMYIATGDRDGGSSWTLGGGVRADNNSIGILKSTDGGQTWSATGLSFGEDERELIGRILIDPTNGQIMLAATTNGIYRTTNGGASWTLEQSGAYFIDMEFKPGDSDIVYASTSDYTAAEIYRSTDNGASWSQVESFSSSRRAELAVTPHDATYVYAIVANSDRGLKGIYKSTDSGANFTLEFDGNSTNGSLLGYYSDGSGSNTGQGSYDLCIAVNPSNKNEVFIGGINTWRSADGGSSWVNNNMWTSYSGYNFSGSPEVHADKHVLKYRESDGTLFEGNDGGIYKTTNSGTSWTDLSNDLYITQIYRLGVAQSVNNMTIIGNQDNGSKMFNGSFWDDVTGGDGMECAIDPIDEDVQYATYVRGILYRTTNGWSNYTTISDNITGGDNGFWVTPYVIDPNDNQTLIVGYDKIWKSTDRGDNWSQLGTLESASDKFRSLAIAESNSSVMVIADPDDIWYSSNGGTSWTDITGTLPTYNYSITYVAIHATDPNTIWVTMGGYDGNRVYESTNGGSSWSNISTGLPNLPTMCIVQNKQETSLNELYVGTDRGVYMKRGAADWEPFMTNLPNVVVTELEIYYDATPANSKLRAATFGRGLWESDLYTDPTSQPVAAFSATPLTGEAPLAVSFTDESTDATSWSWNFGDTNTSTDQNPSHVYGEPGTYTVALTATNSNGSDTETKTDYITVVVPEPVAAFSGTPTSGDAPLMVSFTDASTDATSWSWDFGDSGTSSDQNPSHEYAEPGSYTVALTVTNATGSDTETKANYITVSALQAVAQFEGSPTESNYDTLTVFFTNLSENADDFSWDFGDENTSIEISPSHQYMEPGVYTVSLVASNDYNSDTETKDGYIIVHGVGIDFVNEANISVYPNPGNGLFNISAIDNISGKVTVKILDQKANMVDQIKLNLSQPQQIDLTAQSVGIYYLLFENNGKQFIKKVVVE
jgi:PKD repeat protein